MAYDVNERPYEALFRWDQEGKLIGGHVQRRFVITVDGVVVGEDVRPAAPIALDGNGDFPLVDIMTEVQAGAVAQVNALTAQLETARTAEAAATARADGLAAQLATITAERDALAAQLAAMAPA